MRSPLLSGLPRSLNPLNLNLAPRRLGLRHVLFSAVAMLFCLTLYYTVDLDRLAFDTNINPPMYTVPDKKQRPQTHTYDERVTTPEEWMQRAERVKEAFVHAYRGYEMHAFPNDELKPLTNRSVNNINGWGVTLFDSLDTMLLMGLTSDFTRALTHVSRANFSLPEVEVVDDGRIKETNIIYAPFFETVIRYLGGLLSAYALSPAKEPILLEKADELASLLAPVFNTSSGLPAFGVNTVSKKVSPGTTGVLAEVASCQLEYAYLGHATGKSEHYNRARNIMDVLERANVSALGMLPRRFHLVSGEPLDDILSVGAMSDSGHEYLLKYYLLTARTDKAALDLYISTTTRILSTLFYITPTRELLYVTDTWQSSLSPLPTRRFEHLSCFLPGLLALGLHTLPASAFSLSLSPTHSLNNANDTDIFTRYDLRTLHTLAATGLAESCWTMYADQPTGLGPEQAIMRQGITWFEELRRWHARGAPGTMPGMGEKEPVLEPGIEVRDYTLRRQPYLLRPETVESLFMMWKTTGDARWRERAWTVFEALEREARTDAGYTVIGDVQVSRGPRKDEMPSYFLAETLKYLYLMFHEDDLVPLDRWVFNTEAHPLPVFSWTGS